MLKRIWKSDLFVVIVCIVLIAVVYAFAWNTVNDMRAVDDYKDYSSLSGISIAKPQGGFMQLGDFCELYNHNHPICIALQAPQ